jgi:hypothetical protein
MAKGWVRLSEAHFGVDNADADGGLLEALA